MADSLAAARGAAEVAACVQAQLEAERAAVLQAARDEQPPLLQALAALDEALPRPVLVFTDNDDPALMARALEAGTSSTASETSVAAARGSSQRSSTVITSTSASNLPRTTPTIPAALA